MNELIVALVDIQALIDQGNISEAKFELDRLIAELERTKDETSDTVRR